MHHHIFVLGEKRSFLDFRTGHFSEGEFQIVFHHIVKLSMEAKQSKCCVVFGNPSNCSFIATWVTNHNTEWIFHLACVYTFELNVL